MNLIETYNGSGFYAQYAASADYASNGQPLSAALTAVPDTYLQNTDLTISNNKVTEISGIPLAGGGGGSVDFDYDPNGDISGINGSALAVPTFDTTDMYVKEPLYVGQSAGNIFISINMEFVADVSEATGTDILYVVTGA